MSSQTQTIAFTLGLTLPTQAATIEFRGTGANAATAFENMETAIGSVKWCKKL